MKELSNALFYLLLIIYSGIATLILLLDCSSIIYCYKLLYLVMICIMIGSVYWRIRELTMYYSRDLSRKNKR